MRSELKNINVSIDDNFGLLEEKINKGVSITEQIEAAFVSKISEDNLFYMMSRGISRDKTIGYLDDDKYNKESINNDNCSNYNKYGKNLKNLPSAIGSNTYPIDFKAFLPSESIAAKMNLSANRLKYEALCILDYGS